MTFVALVAAGFVAGVVGSAGGITSLVAYPALLAVGIGPLSANVSATVAILGSGASSTWRAARSGSLAAVTPRLRWLAAGFVLASLGGGLLLIATPSSTFERIAPWLVATGSLALLVYPVIVRRRMIRGVSALAGLAMVVVAAYNGYFGAGSGILVLALVLVTLRPPLPVANDWKNALIFAADLVPSIAFVASGLVRWWAVIPLGIGTLVGGAMGPEVARRVPAYVMRWAIGLLGLAFAAWLLVAGD